MKDFLIDNVSSILLGVILAIALVICVVQRIKMHRQNKKYGFNEYVNEDHEEISTTDRYVHFVKQYIATRQRVSHLDKVFLDCDDSKQKKTLED